MPKSRPRGHHHGDARHALLLAASQLLESAGVQGLSLRQLAAHAGLSRQAPYNHFANKEALLAELVQAGFKRMAAEIRAVRGYPGGVTALAGAAEAYITFAHRSPALFRLMFSCEIVDRTRFPEVAAAGADTYQALVDIVATFASPRQRDELSLAAWSIVHGYAMLRAEAGFEDASTRKQRVRSFARLVRNGVAATESQVAAGWR